MESLLKTAATEVFKGALSAGGGAAMTSFLGLFGYDSSSANMESELKQISGQLTALTLEVQGLHLDLTGIHSSIVALDRDLVSQARAARLQVVAQQIEQAKLLIDRLFGHLAQAPRLAASDREAAATRLAKQVLRDDQVEAALDTVHANLVGTAQAEGGEGALLLLLHAVNATLAAARERNDSVADRARGAFVDGIAPYFRGKIGAQLQGALLLTNAYHADPDIVSPISQQVRTHDAVDDLKGNITAQCGILTQIARSIAVEDWVCEFLYPDTSRGPLRDGGSVHAGALAVSDALVDEALAQGPHVVLRVFVSHCRTGRSAPVPGSHDDEELNAKVAASLSGALHDAVLGAPWWEGGTTLPDPQTERLSSWPPLSKKLLSAIYQPTGVLVVQRIPSDAVSPGNADLLKTLLQSVQGELAPDDRVRADGAPLFSPRLDNVRFPTDEQGHPVGSLNLVTYWSGTFN